MDLIKRRKKLTETEVQVGKTPTYAFGAIDFRFLKVCFLLISSFPFSMSFSCLSVRYFSVDFSEL